MRSAVILRDAPEHLSSPRDMGPTINPWDLHALEQALELRRQRGGTVTIFALGPPERDGLLRHGLALGASEAWRLEPSSAEEPPLGGSAPLLAEACETRGPFDCILLGDQNPAAPWDMPGPGTALLLGIPFCTAVKTLRLEEKGLHLAQSTGEGRELQYLPFPCLVTLAPRGNSSLLPSLGGAQRSRFREIQVLRLK